MIKWLLLLPLLVGTAYIVASRISVLIAPMIVVDICALTVWFDRSFIRSRKHRGNGV